MTTFPEEAHGRKASPTWHLVTGEYPPRPGGVSEYTEQIALALSAAGENVHVWTSSSVVFRQDGRISVHGIPDFGPSGLRQLSAKLGRMAGPKRLFVQYVAPAFGLWGVNVPLCLWLADRSVEEVWVQFHEVAYAFAWRQALRHNALALVQWWMAQLVAERAQRIFISVPGWRRQLGRHAERAEVLPIPSNVPDRVTEAGVASVRARMGAAPLVGHFGTYGRLVTDLLEPVVVGVLRSAPEVRFLMLGRGGPNFAGHLASTYPDIASRIFAPGPLEAPGVSTHLAACDLMIQPYPDGISGRRTSAMAGLALGKAIITTTGHLTEAEWSTSAAVDLTPADRIDQLTRTAIRLLSARSERDALGARGQKWYRTHFSMATTIERLLNSPRLVVEEPILL